MQSGMLQVSKTEEVTHELYYELTGDMESQINVLFLHGGPGSGFNSARNQ